MSFQIDCFTYDPDAFSLIKIFATICVIIYKLKNLPSLLKPFNTYI